MDNVKKKVMGSGKHERCHNSLQNGGNIPLRSGKAIQRAEDDTVQPDPWESFH